MIERIIKSINTWLYLKRSGTRHGQGVILEGKRNINLGLNVDLADGVRIRSRTNEATIFIGHSVRLRQFTEINAKGEPIEIGANCYIGKEVWIGGMGSIKIGVNTMVGIRTIIVSSDHNYMNITVPYFEHSEIRKPIYIGENVWVGANCVILGGTQIGDGSVIGAGSVVNGCFPENSFIVGVPGKLRKIVERN